MSSLVMLEWVNSSGLNRKTPKYIPHLAMWWKIWWPTLNNQRTTMLDLWIWYCVQFWISPRFVQTEEYEYVLLFFSTWSRSLFYIHMNGMYFFLCSRSMHESRWMCVWVYIFVGWNGHRRLFRYGRSIADVRYCQTNTNFYFVTGEQIRILFVAQIGE